MSRSVAGHGRSTVDWGVRGFVAVLALVIAYASLCRTLAYVSRRGDVARAHVLAPGDGRITAAMASGLSGVRATTDDRQRADALARTALLQNPTAVSAAATLGLNAEIRQDRRTARHFLNYSQKLSRRDTATQLWAIEEAVKRNDIPSALRHYDIALRTSRRAYDLLFPVLAAASADRTIRAELLRTLASRPAWGDSFLDYLSQNSPDPVSAADLFRRLTRLNVPVSFSARAAILNALVTNGRIDEAWTYYASFRPGVDRRRARDERFAGTEVPTIFDWSFREEGVSASIQRGEAGGVFEFSAPSGAGGAVLQQTQILPPGAYRIEGRGVDIVQSGASGPYWSLRCEKGAELGRVDVSSSDDGTFMGRFVVPADCPLQQLTLMVRPSDAVAGTSGKIGYVRLYPEFAK